MPVLVHGALAVPSHALSRTALTPRKRQSSRRNNCAAQCEKNSWRTVQAILEVASAARRVGRGCSPPVEASGQAALPVSATGSTAAVVSNSDAGSGLRRGHTNDQKAQTHAVHRSLGAGYPYRSFESVVDPPAPDDPSTSRCEAAHSTGNRHPERRITDIILAGPVSHPILSCPTKGSLPLRTLQLPAGSRRLLFPSGRGGGSLKAPTGLSCCTIVEDAPFPPPNTQVVMELHEKTVRVGRRRLRYRGFRPSDRLVLPALPTSHQPPHQASWGASYPLGTDAAGPPAAACAPQAPYTALPQPQPQLQQVVVPLRSQNHPHAHPPPADYRPSQYDDDHHQRRPQDLHHHYQHLLHHPHHYHQRNHHHQHPRPQHQHQQIRLSIKVPWAQPHEVCPPGGRGLLESLNDALSCGSGYMMVGAAVRPGCTLLQLDLLTFGAPFAPKHTGRLRGGSGGELATAMPAATSVASGLEAGGSCDAGGDGGGDGSNASGRFVASGSEAELQELAKRLACRVSELAPPPSSPSAPGLGLGPADGVPSQMVVSLGGGSSYVVSYSASTEEWTATLLGDGELGAAVAGDGWQAAPAADLLRRLGGPRCALRAWTSSPALAWPPPPPLDGGDGGGAFEVQGRRPPGELGLALFVEVSDPAVALLLAEALQPLNLMSSIGQQDEQEQRPWREKDEESEEQGQQKRQQEQQQEQRRHHIGPLEWQLAANCLGRSLPVSVFRVLPISTDIVATGVSNDSDNNSTGGRGNGGDPGSPVNAHDKGAATLVPTPFPTPARVRIDLAVSGCTAALAAASCRLAILSLDLWCGISHVGRAPVMLVRAAGGSTAAAATAFVTQPPDEVQLAGAAADPHDGESDGVVFRGGTDTDGKPDADPSSVAVQRMVAELCQFAANANDNDDDVNGSGGNGDGDDKGGGEDGGDPGCSGQCVQQLFADITALELYAAAAAAAASSGRGRGVGAAATAQPPAQEEAPSGQEPQQPQPGELAAPAPLLAGSVDLSGELLQQLGGAAPQQRRALLQVGANLLSYTVLHGMPYVSEFVRGRLASLGCGLAEADALACGVKGGVEVGAAASDGGGGDLPRDEDVDVDAGYLHRDGDAGDDLGPGRGLNVVPAAVQHPDSGSGSDPIPVDPPLADLDGVPLVHLAVLSGSLPTVAAVLRWAAEEGLGPEWVLRRHAGRTPLQTAAAAAAAAAVDQGSDDGGGGVGRGVACGDGVDADYAAYLAQAAALLAGGMLSQVTAAVAAEQEKEAEEEGAGLLAAGEEAEEEGAAEATVAEAPGVRRRMVLSTARACLKAEGKGPEDPEGTEPCWSSVTCSPPALTARGPQRRHRTPARALLAVNRLYDILTAARRHPMIVCVLGYPDAATEARFRRFSMSYDIHAASYWVPLMCFLLLAALLRQLRSGGSGGDPSEAPVSILFAWPYVPLAAALLLCPHLVHPHLRGCFILCSAARLSVKPLCAAGILATPLSMVQYTRVGVMLVTDTVFPALCERVGGFTAVAFRIADAAAHFSFVLKTGLAETPVGAAVHALLRFTMYWSCAVAVERYHRTRFEAAAAGSSSAVTVAGSFPGGTGAGAGGKRGVRGAAAAAQAGRSAKVGIAGAAELGMGGGLEPAAW